MEVVPDGRIPVEEYWRDLILYTTEMGLDNSKELYLRDYEITIFRHTITKILQDKFGAETQRSNKGSILVFKHIDRLKSLFKMYTENQTIACSVSGSCRKSR